MSEQHTPGPWEAQPRDTRERGIAIVAVHVEIRKGSTPTRGMTAWVGQGGANFAKPHVQEANARLIAAAPDLLDALYGLLELGRKDTSNPKYDEYYADARAAIAKAEGCVTKDTKTKETK